METAEIIKRLDTIQNQFLAFDSSSFSDGGYRETSTPPDVRIARAVYWIELLRRQLQPDGDGRPRLDSSPGGPECPPEPAVDRL